MRCNWNQFITRQSSDFRLPFSFPAVFIAAGRSLGRRRLSRRRCLYRIIALAFMAFAGIANAQPAPSEPPMLSSEHGPFAQFVSEAALRFGIPSSWIVAVMQVESAGDVRAISQKGAMGLMQIMPATWTDLRARLGLADDPFDPHDNILVGAAYLRELHDRYGSAGFLAAYNAGPGRYDALLATGDPLPPETQAYVDSVTRLLRGGGSAIDATDAIIARPWTAAPLFPVHADSTQSATKPQIATPPVQSGSATSAADLTGLAPRSAGLFVPMSARESGS